MRSRYLLGRLLSTAVSAMCLLSALNPTFPELGPWFAVFGSMILTGIFFEISTTLARKYADVAAPAAARYLRPLELAIVPLAVPLGWIGARIHAAGAAESSNPRVTEAEVEIMVEEVGRSGFFGPERGEMIRNVLEFGDRTAEDVMIPRERVESIEHTTPLEKVLALVSESGHSRYPVFKEQVDNVCGLLHAKDLFKVLDERRMKQTSLKDLIRPANFVAESQPLSSLLREMRGRRQHLAIVVNELGSMAGIVTLEDVLEEIVGDIRDEHDEHEEGLEAEADGEIHELGDGRLVAGGGVTIGDLSAYLGANLPATGRYESIGGMLTEHAGKVPAIGTAISKFGFHFIVRDSDENRVAKVEIIRPRTAEA
jgi:CBS domain containing-hemolysin-like protein